MKPNKESAFSGLLFVIMGVLIAIAAILHGLYILSPLGLFIIAIGLMFITRYFRSKKDNDNQD